MGWLQRLANAILGRVPGKVGRFETATLMMRDGDFRAPVVRPAVRDRYNSEPQIDPLEELQRLVSPDDNVSAVPPSFSRVADGARAIRSPRKKPGRR